MLDLRLAFRQLAKSPGFTALALLTLALGIGACSAIFTVVNSVLLRPVAYPQSEELVVIRETRLPEYPDFSLSPANYLDYAAADDVFARSYLIRGSSLNLTGRGEPVRVNAVRVTGGYFETLRVQPVLGRAFTEEDDTPERGRVAVLSHAFWQKQFGGRADALGQTLRLNGELFTVLGVMPEDFQRGRPTELYLPMGFGETQWAQRGAHYLSAVARLRPGVTVEQARVRLEAISVQLAEAYPDTNRRWGVRVVPILDYNTGSLRPTLLVLLGAVGFLLLIACANVANLLLARATARQREISIRSALGASRGRILRQLLTESVLLGLLGGVLGVLVAHWALDGLLAIAPRDLPRAAEITLDGRALAATLALSLVTGVVFGIAPAVQSLRVNLVDALKEGARGASESGRRRWLRGGLVVAEIALALILLTGAGLLIRSFVKLNQATPGFDPHGALWVNLALPAEKYDTPEKIVAFADALQARLEAIPGVGEVASTHSLPFSGSDWVLAIEFEGRELAPSELPSATYFAVSPGYFRTMRIPVIRGRAFEPTDRLGSTPVTIISQSFAQAHFAGQDPLGRRINITGGPTTWREIVGVVADVKDDALDQVTGPQAYDPSLQVPYPALSFVIRAQPGVVPTSLGSALRREVYAVDPEQPVFRVEALEELVADSVARQRFAMVLLSVFSTVALAIASIGIYGVMAYAVSQRTREFGIRLALGATPADVRRLVLSQAGRLISWGLALGLVGALAAAQVLQSMLFETGARDPLVLTSIGLLLAAVALIAALVPARRATQVNPMVALRSD